MATKETNSESQTSLETTGVEFTVTGRPVFGLRELAWRRFRRHHLAVVSVIILTVLALSVIFASQLSGPNDPYTPDLHNLRAAPSPEHILGTDGAGRDMFSRILFGGRVSLSVGIIATSIYMHHRFHRR